MTSQWPCCCKEQQWKSLLGIWFYSYAKLERHFASVVYTNMAVLSRDWKPRIVFFFQLINLFQRQMLSTHAVSDSLLFRKLSLPGGTNSLCMFFLFLSFFLSPDNSVINRTACNCHNYQIKSKSNQINCLSSITRGVVVPSPEPEAHVLSVQAFRVELEFRSAGF